MTPSLLRQLIEAVAEQVVAAADELTALDRETGDGDHGLNLKRGCEAVLAQADQIACKPLPEALKSIGNILLMKVGGASGPLYGTLLVVMGKDIGSDAESMPAALDQGLTAVRRLGKSDTGCKTMLDVLVPVQLLLTAGGRDLPARVKRCAAEAATATIPMKARRGLASFHGERSIGHMDPGARSAQIILTAICDVLARAPMPDS